MDKRKQLLETAAAIRGLSLAFAILGLVAVAATSPSDLWNMNYLIGAAVIAGGGWLVAWFIEDFAKPPE